MNIPTTTHTVNPDGSKTVDSLRLKQLDMNRSENIKSNVMTKPVPVKKINEHQIQSSMERLQSERDAAVERQNELEEKLRMVRFQSGLKNRKLKAEIVQLKEQTVHLESILATQQQERDEENQRHQKDMDLTLARHGYTLEELGMLHEHSETKNQGLKGKIDKLHEEEMDFIKLRYGIEIASVDKNSCLGPIDRTTEESNARIGNYLEPHKLNEGGFGTVYSGEHCVTRQPFAIKKIGKRTMRKPEDLHQLEQEVTVLQETRHTNIPVFQEVINARNNIYIVMELGDTDLRTYVDGFGYDLSRNERGVQAVMSGLVSALCYLHKNGICHMDIKPQNLVLKRLTHPDMLVPEDIKLCDFGLVVRSENGRPPVKCQGTVGTTGFYAPEMKMSTVQSYNACAADMWSVGCTLMDLTETTPSDWINSYHFSDGEFRVAINDRLKHIREPRFFTSNHDFRELVDGLLQWYPDSRFTAADLYKHAWFYEFFDDYNSDSFTEVSNLDNDNWNTLTVLGRTRPGGSWEELYADDAESLNLEQQSRALSDEDENVLSVVDEYS